MPSRRTALTVPIFETSSTEAKVNTRLKLKPKLNRRPKTKATFLSLPADIRTKIFSYVLVFPRDIHIRQLPSGKYGIFITDPVAGFTIQGSWMRFAGPDFPSHLTTSLLLTNRQISKEAKTVLYGSNTFVVADVEDIFKCCPRRTQPYIKRIKILGGWGPELKDIVRTLELHADVVQLERLDFSIDTLTTKSAKKDVPTLVKKLVPLLMVWKEKQGLSLEDTVDLVGFATGDDGIGDVYTKYNQERLVAAEQWDREAKKQVREQFEKAESEAFCMGRFLEVVRETQNELQV